MSSEEWLENNFRISEEYNAISWGDGLYTDIPVFLDMFGDIIRAALNTEEDPKQAIRDSDPNNAKGYNNLL